jgi:hypothetical protein
MVECLSAGLNIIGLLMVLIIEASHFFLLSLHSFFSRPEEAGVSLLKHGVVINIFFA